MMLILLLLLRTNVQLQLLIFCSQETWLTAVTAVTVGVLRLRLAILAVNVTHWTENGQSVFVRRLIADSQHRRGGMHVAVRRGWRGCEAACCPVGPTFSLEYSALTEARRVYAPALSFSSCVY